MDAATMPRVMSDGKVAVRARVTGIVQGVGYRWFAEAAARRSGVLGWVRNLRDGSVECHAEGANVAVEAFLLELRRGPRAARVEGVDAHAVPPENPAAFEVRPTG